MQKINYQLMLESEIKIISQNGTKPKLLLHTCCAPCSSYVLEYLASIFDITVYYYNPNITEKNEYTFRTEEVKRLLAEMTDNTVHFAEGEYEPKSFFDAVKGLESEKEGGKRCSRCYRLRIKKTAEYAKEHGFDYFTTTLSISPLKNAEKLNEIGKEESEKVGVKYLFSDFKKKNGYKRSIELSKKYNLYRQNYCGCIFSKTKEN